MLFPSRYCRIEMLGGLRVVLPDHSFTRFRTQKAAHLLAYLARYAHRSHSRDHLINLFWPDVDLDLGRDSLSSALTSLRRQLEPTGVVAGSVVEADRQQVRLNPNSVSTDVAEFDSLLAVAASPDRGQDASKRILALKQATGLYKGEFLPGHYEDWVAQDQTRLARRYTEAQLALAALLEESGELPEALSTARRALAIDPYNEDACHLLMRMQARTGYVAGALETYKNLAERFRQDFQGAPGRTLQILAERIRREPEAFRNAIAGDERAQESVVSTTTRASEPSEDFPPLASLPLQATSFIGRNHEKSQLVDLLIPQANGGIYAPKRRMVTLSGPGGVGKTRLAVETAGELVDSFRGGVCFVSLAEVQHPRLIPFALAQALQIRPASNMDLLDQIIKRLDAGPTLLLLDNCEHLLQLRSEAKVDNAAASDVSSLVRLLLERAPNLSLLITSRRILHLTVEQEFALAPLAIPEDNYLFESVETVGSMALYQDRAQRALAGFAVTTQNAEAVATLCRKLEGMPLALEMAAAWVKTVSPEQMLERLGSRLDVLVSRQRSLSARQRSLRATIEWSYDLLPPERQALFTRLSVFRGGWTVEAAAGVCNLPEHECLDGLLELQQHSMVIYEESEGGGRYHFLETLRQFGWDKLVEAETLESTRNRHLDYFVTTAEENEGKLFGPEQNAWMEQLAADMDNYRAALHWANHAPEQHEKGLRLANSIFQFWHKRAHLVEGYTHLLAALHSTASGQSDARARALNAAGTLASMRGNYEAAKPLHEESLAQYQELDNSWKMAAPLTNLGIIARYQGDYASARDRFEKALTIYKEQGNMRGVGGMYQNLGSAVYDQGDLTAARDYLIESLSVLRGIGENWGVAWSLLRLGNVDLAQGQLAAAQVYLDESLTMFRDIGDRKGLATVLQGLGSVARQRSDFDSALIYYRESLIIRRDTGEMPGIASSLDSFAMLAVAPDAECGSVRAARLFGAAQALRKQIGVALAPIDQKEIEPVMASAKEKLETSLWAAEWSAGRCMGWEQAINYALE